MGLGITAYSHLTPVGVNIEGWCQDDNHVQTYTYHPFDASFRGLPVLDADLEFTYGACYQPTARTERHTFRAGSYSGYREWRADLQRQFNPDRSQDRPFYELLWFADERGTIGPDAARDLLADFRQHADLYAPLPDGDDWYKNMFRDRYADWTRACELAADGGLISFN